MKMQISDTFEHFFGMLNRIAAGVPSNKQNAPVRSPRTRFACGVLIYFLRASSRETRYSLGVMPVYLRNTWLK